MRLFWSIILLLAAITGVLVWQRTAPPTSASPQPPALARDAMPGPAGERATKPAAPAPATPAIIETAADAIVTPAPPALVPNAPLAPEPLASPTPPPALPSPQPPAPVATTTSADPAPAPATDAAAAITRELDQLLGSADGEISKPVVATPVDAPETKAVQSDTTSSGARVVQRDDGAMLIDDRFIVRGKGTEADPYRLPWELLVSAQETYAPRKGLKKIPARLSMFDNTNVRISGFVAFPITSTSPREMLVMLSQWDGCCIGMPPTPYDAVEVRLATTPTPSQRSSNQGTLRGVLKIDPLEDAGWLLGMYVIENGKLTTEE